jgi:hypothetical protein
LVQAQACANIFFKLKERPAGRHYCKAPSWLPLRPCGRQQSRLVYFAGMIGKVM